MRPRGHGPSRRSPRSRTTSAAKRNRHLPSDLSKARRLVREPGGDLRQRSASESSLWATVPRWWTRMRLGFGSRRLYRRHALTTSAQRTHPAYISRTTARATNSTRRATRATPRPPPSPPSDFPVVVQTSRLEAPRAWKRRAGARAARSQGPTTGAVGRSAGAGARASRRRGHKGERRRRLPTTARASPGAPVLRPDGAARSSSLAAGTHPANPPARPRAP